MLSPAETIQAFHPQILIFVSRLIGPPGGYVWTKWYADRSFKQAWESQHRVACAIDVAPLRATGLPANPPWWWRQEIERRGLIYVVEPDHGHIQLWPAGALARAGVDFDFLA